MSVEDIDHGFFFLMNCSKIKERTHRVLIAVEVFNHRDIT